MVKFFSIAISDKKMAKVMYALIKTGSRLLNTYSLGISEYTRKQSSGFKVTITIDINEDQISKFEDSAGVKLQTSEEFQGTLHLNDNSLPPLSDPK